MMHECDTKENQASFLQAEIELNLKLLHLHVSHYYYAVLEAKYRNLLLMLSSHVLSQRKVINFLPLCSCHASPAALARGSAGALPSDATAPPTQPVHPCTHRSDLKVDKVREGTVRKGADTEALNFPLLSCNQTLEEFRGISMSLVVKLQSHTHTRTHKAAIQMNEHLTAGNKI